MTGSTRGKTTPASTAGSFRPHAGRTSRATPEPARAPVTVADLPALLATNDPDIGYSTYQADDTCWIAVTTSRSGTRVTPYINEGGYGIPADTIRLAPGESPGQTIVNLLNTPPTAPAIADERSERDGL